MRQVVNEHSDGVVVQNADGAIVGFNPSALRVLGLNADQLIGRSSVDPQWRAVLPDGSPLPGELHPAMVCLRTGNEQRNKIMGVETPDGAIRWLSVDSLPTDFDDDRGAVTIFSDITEQFLAEKSMRSSLEILQRALLPDALPSVEHFDFAVEYRNASDDAMVGGDFYDVFVIDEHRFAFLIGDACGHDVHTVAMTSLGRNTLRSAGLHIDDPSVVLGWLHDSLVSRHDATLCTAIYGVVDHDGVAARMRVAIAGHPLPLLLRNGKTVPVGVGGSLLGIAGYGCRVTTSEIELLAGDQIVLYTDGLLDCPRPRPTEEQFMERLTRGNSALETLEMTFRSAPVEGIRSDDTAVLVISYR